MMKPLIRPIAASIFAFTILAGVVYPLAVTGLAQLLFPEKANGSLIVRDGRAVGSSLIGRHFDDPKYFWSRLSSTSLFPYNAASSSGSNYSMGNPALLDRAKARITALRDADPQAASPVPVDLATASGSGVDPHISPAAAEYQIRRVAKARNLDESELRLLVRAHTEGRTFGFLGEPRVNVLELNLALDGLR